MSDNNPHVQSAPPMTPGVDSSAKLSEGAIARRKHWEEMNDSEKIGALREACFNLGSRQQKHEQVLTILEQHGHDATGQIIVRAPSILSQYGTSPVGYTFDPVRVIRTKYERRED